MTEPKPFWQPDELTIDKESLDEALEMREDFVSLLQHRGWKRLEELAQRDVIEPAHAKYFGMALTSQDEVLAEQYAKGHVGGILFILAQPQELLDQANALIDTAQALEENDES